MLFQEAQCLAREAGDNWSMLRALLGLVDVARGRSDATELTAGTLALEVSGNPMPAR
ncbi:MAG: hypothetical protein ACRDG4_08450 [Chloroflexota bacterium]